jgi:hypothetical protein
MWTLQSKLHAKPVGRQFCGVCGQGDILRTEEGQPAGFRSAREWLALPGLTTADSMHPANQARSGHAIVQTVTRRTKTLRHIFLLSYFLSS